MRSECRTRQAVLQRVRTAHAGLRRGPGGGERASIGLGAFGRRSGLRCAGVPQLAGFRGTIEYRVRRILAAAGILTIIGPKIGLILFVTAIASWLYWALCESSAWQATLGKKALGIIVTDLEGRRISFGRASGRFWAGRGAGSIPYLGGTYFLVDCICVGFTEKKQAIHDMIASCLVLRKL